MSVERTLAILKPDAFEGRKCGKIIDHVEREGFRILASRVVRLTRKQAAAFYAVHSERPFFEPLVEFMISGQCMALALERADAIRQLRSVIGATDPAEADAGTIRALYAESKERNAIHASDSPENAYVELGFFFAGLELTG